MKISFQSKGRSFSIRFPTFCLLNAITGAILCRRGHSVCASEIKISLPRSYQQTRKLMRCLRKCGHALGALPLVAIEEKNGQKIQIML